MGNHRETGRRREEQAAAFLKRNGYEILEQNYRDRYGELDLVARSREGIVCFVEVKLRGPKSIGLPREAVDARKQARLRRTAEAYLGCYELDAPARFDVAEVYCAENGAMRVEYLAGAFE